MYGSSIEASAVVSFTVLVELEVELLLHDTNPTKDKTPSKNNNTFFKNYSPPVSHILAIRTNVSVLFISFKHKKP